MSKTLLRRSFILMLAAFLTAAFAAAAGPAHALLQKGATMQIALTGVFLPPKETDASSMQNYDVDLEGKDVSFAVKNAVNLRDVSDTPAEILNRIIFAKISIYGSDEAMKTLKDPSVMGKTVQLSGIFYTQSARFYVGTVKILKK